MPRLRQAPAPQKRRPFIEPVGAVHCEYDAISLEPNGLRQRGLDNESVLTAKVEMSFPFLVRARRSPWAIALRPGLLRDNPASTSPNPFFDVR